ncbi:reactive mitochondrial oxygen species modulator 1-domain-containing protein [Pavlovales sp. CCMP2436]|nr:reactive mitochondrial oxygen species modulator 1-domain-containing protein [Pavlovales sp. CCMP2436]
MADKEDDKYEAEDFSKYLPESAKKDQPAQKWQFYQPEQSSRVNQCFQRIKNGAMLGGALGGSFGFLYGTYAAIAYRHILYIPISVVQAGFGFGLFLACGMVIRCDDQLPNRRLTNFPTDHVD